MDAIVLAAGASTRMGRPKALLPRGPDTFLARVCAAVRGAGCERVLVVVAQPHGDEVARVARELGAEVVWNEHPEAGQVRSMAVGLAAARGGAALIALVDAPDWLSSTGRAIAQADGAVHVPVHGGRRGHPVCLPTALAGALAGAGPGESAREVIARLSVPVREHDVADAGILLDVDTPDDLRRLEPR